jgi:hypothetical protein
VLTDSWHEKSNAAIQYFNTISVIAFFISLLHLFQSWVAPRRIRSVNLEKMASDIMFDHTVITDTTIKGYLVWDEYDQH